MAFKGSDSCHNKAGDDEPIFTLRAKDRLAPLAVKAWAVMAQLLGVDKKKVEEAFDCAAAMFEWQGRNGCKVPD